MVNQKKDIETLIENSIVKVSKMERYFANDLKRVQLLKNDLIEIKSKNLSRGR